MLQLLGIPGNLFATIPCAPWLGGLQSPRDPSRTLRVRPRKIIIPHWLNRVWTCGKFPCCYAILEVLTTLSDALTSGPVADCVLVNSDYSVWSGATTALLNACCTPSRALTAYQQMVEVSLQALFAFYCSTDRTRSVGLDCPTSSPIGFWISDLWDDGGSCATICEIMTSIPANGPIQKCRCTPSQKNHCDLIWYAADEPAGQMDVSLPNTDTPALETSSLSETSSSKAANDPVDMVLLPKSNGDVREEEDDWEVINEELIYADCHGVIEPDVLVPKNPISLVSLDSDHPLVQIGPAVFEGRYENACGTYLFVERVSNTTGLGNVPRAGSVEQGHMTTAMDRPSSTRYPLPSFPIIKCTKILILDRIFLRPKQSDESAAPIDLEQMITPSNPENEFTLKPSPSPSAPSRRNI
ncbi:hypothetical protein D915_007557 [Fasciola hepatica]|uniref:Transcription factor TFIIIC triple barrel domain-containing protein n=1 Tax=Fasciola hepatica TaxID=6192 RepID=A0A2H1C3R8_FASHE|nr:hypothetical protein D915_007557 [Fasciola hepatica]